MKKTQLPEGYQQIEYIKMIPSQRYIVSGYATENDVKARIKELKEVCISSEYDMCCEVKQSIVSYALILPEAATEFLSEEERGHLTKEEKPKTMEYKIPRLFRFIDKEFVDAFFEKGDIRISTFDKCKKLENCRIDKDEGTIVTIGHEGELTAEIKCGVSNAFMLCTSMSIKNQLIDGTTYESCIEIVNLNGFIQCITQALENKGYKIVGIKCGPCNYDNRKIERTCDTKHIQTIEDQIKENGNAFDFGEMFRMAAEISEQQEYFSKTLPFAIENEFRIVWVPEGELKEEYLDINCKEAVKFCKRHDFKMQ